MRNGAALLTQSVPVDTQGPVLTMTARGYSSPSSRASAYGTYSDASAIASMTCTWAGPTGIITSACSFSNGSWSWSTNVSVGYDLTNYVQVNAVDIFGNSSSIKQHV